MKSTKDIPYSHEEAERAGGLMPAKEKFTDLIYSGKTKIKDYKEKLEQNQKQM